MRNHSLILSICATLAATAVAPVALAQTSDQRWQGDNNGGWDPADHYHADRYHQRRLGQDDRVYRGRDGRYYCRRSNGTTGLVIGAIGGAALGHAIGGDALGTLLGAGAGALAGRSIDRSRVRCR